MTYSLKIGVSKMLNLDLVEVDATYKEMGVDYWLRRTQEVLERVQE